MEGLFTLDQTAQDIKKLLLTGKKEQLTVEVADIKEIVSVSNAYALLKVKKDARQTYVAVSLMKNGSKQFSEFME